MMRSIAAAIDEAARLLGSAGVDSPRLEARLLLAHALATTPEGLLRDRATPADVSALEPLMARRLAREPLAFILGQREFWGLPFAVSPATLVPRPDSEALIEAAIAACPDRSLVRSVLDLGTGTGCLLLAALTEFPAAHGIGIDVFPAATALAQRNAAMLGLRNRSAFITGDWASSVVGRFDLVLSNPPYIASHTISQLMPEVALHEPASALDGGPQGLSAYHVIIPELPRLLETGGTAILEVGDGQAAAVADLGQASGLDVLAIRADLAGIARAVVLRLPAAEKTFG
jgi:release factor glutamine methyltransferase